MLSVVIPVYNEQDNVESLVREVVGAQKNTPITEIVFVDDASTDGTVRILKALKKEFPIVRIVQHGVQAGQSAAMYTGAQAAQGSLVVFLDGDGQNDPADIPLLYRAYETTKTDQGRLLVAGQRRKRQDSFLKKISSRIANAIRAGLLKDQTRDTGCSLKLMRRADYIALPFFNHMHRYIPALMLRQGVEIVHVDVSHRARERGVSKYGFWDRLWAGIFDLGGVLWLLKRMRPANFYIQDSTE